MNNKEFNTKIWDQVGVSSPEQLKKVEFGRTFMAIDAYPQLKKATEVLGPMGIGFGLINIEKEIIVIHKTVKDDNDVNYLMMTATFWYKYPNMDINGQFQIVNGMEIVANNDAPKKIVTNLITKALSYLGFNYDVFSGIWDDDPYAGRPDVPATEAMKYNFNLLLKSEAFDKVKVKSLIQFQINAGWTAQSMTNFIEKAPDVIRNRGFEPPSLITEADYGILQRQGSGEIQANDQDESEATTEEP